MLKNIFITILLICSVLVVWGQKSVKVKVSGNIITTDGVPAEFINIQLKNTFYGGTSDGKGYFEFIQLKRYQNLKGITDPEEYLKTIKADGYATSSKYVENTMRIVTQYNLQKYDTKGKLCSLRCNS